MRGEKALDGKVFVEIRPMYANPAADQATIVALFDGRLL
jgi:hypothetical protein